MQSGTAPASSTYSTSQRIAPAVKRYAFAVLCAVAALLATLWIRNPLFPTPLYFAAVSVATWYGGGIPGALVVVIATLGLNYYFVPPEGSFALNKPESPYLLQFALPALLTCWFVRRRKIAEVSLRRSRDELASRVEERQAELARVSRILSIGEMGVSIAHEVNQPLMAVVLHGDACLQWLSAAPPNLDEARRAVNRMIEEGTRAGDIVRRIKALSRKSAPHQEPLNLNNLTSEVFDLLERDLDRKHITGRLELAASVPTINGDPVQLRQVIFNLCLNAIEAMSAEGPRELIVRTSAAEPSSVLVTVQDTGPGLPPGDPDQLFAAFFTTKPEGVGIGLSISRTIVEAHGGKLWAANAATGRGAIFHFQLPALGTKS